MRTYIEALRENFKENTKNKRLTIKNNFAQRTHLGEKFSKFDKSITPLKEGLNRDRVHLEMQKLSLDNY